ncbi:phosphotransferase [Streptomyces sp. NPDC048277]|uniref:phosphotransferase n=1 Tax=Streptomyces sp. NPDC048277 TaxID=3155027 RepID=UPI0033F598CD
MGTAFRSSPAPRRSVLVPAACRLPLPVPAPVRVGRPTAQYPWSWCVVPYLPGAIAARSEPDDLGSAAALGGFLAGRAEGHPDRAGARRAGRRDR